jgi:drug/metabolite transporter (DMT)-like permease
VSATLAPLSVRLGLLVVIALSATAYISLLRVTTEAGVPPFGFIFWHCIASAIVLVPIMIVRRTPLRLGRAELKFCTVSAALGLALPFIALVLASPRVPVGIVGMVMTIEPAFTYLIALFLFIERFRWLRVGGVLLGVGGLLLIVLPEASLPSPTMVPWVLIAFAMPLCWACWSNWIAVALPPELGGVVATFGLMTIAALMLFPVAAATGQLWWFSGPHGDMWWVLPIFAVINAVLWTAEFESVRVSGPVFYSLWGFIGTPMAIGAGMVFFDEIHSLWIWSALVVLFASLWLVNRTMDAVRLRE